MERTDAVAEGLDATARQFFDRAGLGPDCARVYAQLAGRSVATVAQLSAESGLPTESVNGAVDDLADRGFVRVSRDEPATVSVLSPDAGIADAINCSEQRAADGLGQLSELRAASASFGRALSTLRASQDAASFERLDDAEATVSRLHELNHHTQEEILTCVPSKPASGSLLEARVEDAKLLARGIRVRGIYLQACRNDPAVMEYLEWMHVQGASVRLAPTLPARLQIFDRRTAVVAESADGSRPGAILVHSEGLVNALLRLFDFAWDAARAPFGVATAEIGLPPQQRELIRLLARGSKDESVARQMGVSARTVRRAISELSAELGAASRFELGVKCAQLGWVEATRPAAAPGAPSGSGPGVDPQVR